MKIKFTGKYKSITSFEWSDIPDFVIITGPNGSGKSQLLELIYNSIIENINFKDKAVIENKKIKPNEVTYIKGEWNLKNTGRTNLSTIQQQQDQYYNNFKNGGGRGPRNKLKAYYVFQEMRDLIGKKPEELSLEDFRKHLPEIIIEEEDELSTKMGEVFYNYRLSEIELLAKNKSEQEIISEIGRKPWVVLKDILKEAKLPFDVNDPAILGFKDSFQLKLTHQILNEEINFNDLSSGEKVLISLMFYLYNSQEKNIFPKLLLMDEPDAHLHPSMCQQFLNVIKNVLVDKYGVQVIMTTHSPSTVILSADYSI